MSYYGCVVVGGSFATLDASFAHKVTQPAEQIEHCVAHVSEKRLQHGCLFEHLVFVLGFIALL